MAKSPSAWTHERKTRLSLFRPSVRRAGGWAGGRVGGVWPATFTRGTTGRTGRLTKLPAGASQIQMPFDDDSHRQRHSHSFVFLLAGCHRRQASTTFKRRPLLNFQLKKLLHSECLSRFIPWISERTAVVVVKTLFRLYYSCVTSVYFSATKVAITVTITWL